MKVHFPEVERKAIVNLSQETLWTEDSEDVRETLNYLRVERGLTDDVIKKFRFGYYPQRKKKQN
jgi:pimeloyl-CoA synthetase